MNSSQLTETINSTSSFYIIPKAKELFYFYPEHLNFSDFEKHLKIFNSEGKIKLYNDFVFTITDQSCIELVSKRRMMEQQMRFISKKFREIKFEKLGIRGLFISIRDMKPIIIVVTSNDFSSEILRKIGKKLNLYEELQIMLITSPKDIGLELRDVVTLLNSASVYNYEKIHEEILGYLLFKMGDAIPNLPVDFLKGVRLIKTFQIKKIEQPSKIDSFLKLFFK